MSSSSFRCLFSFLMLVKKQTDHHFLYENSLVPHIWHHYQHVWPSYHPYGPAHCQMTTGPYQGVNNVLFYFHLPCLPLTPDRCKVNPGCCCSAPQSSFLEKWLPFLLCFSFYVFFFQVLFFISMFFLSSNTLIKRTLLWTSVLRMDVQVRAVRPLNGSVSQNR